MTSVTIALCTFNGAKHLREQLESFIAQTRPPEELVVCDDGSTDETMMILHEFASGSPFPVRVYGNEQRLGSTANFQKVIALSDGEIIFLSDQDDIWHPLKVETFLESFSFSASTALVFCNVDFVREDRSRYERNLFEVMGFTEERQQSFQRGNDLKYLLESNIVLGCALAFRSKFRHLVSPIPTNIPKVIHDYWIALTLSAVSSCVPIRRSLVDYRQHPYQQTGYKNVLHDNGKEEKKLRFWQRRGIINDFAATLNGLSVMRDRALEVKFRVEDVFPHQLEKINHAINGIDEQIAHFNRRREILSLVGVKKMALTLKELSTKRYHRYSNGSMSALKDLWSLPKFGGR